MLEIKPTKFCRLFSVYLIGFYLVWEKKFTRRINALIEIFDLLEFRFSIEIEQIRAAKNKLHLRKKIIRETSQCYYFVKSPINRLNEFGWK
jgi:hypothetical protein